MATCASIPKDFYAWFNDQAKFLAAREFDKLDVENLVEEIIEMGESYARELESCLRVLFMHILKWEFQSFRRCKSWENSIKEHRRRAIRRLQKTPSLKSRLTELSLDAYDDARYEASQETGIEYEVFPEKMFFSLEEVLADGWLPTREL